MTYSRKPIPARVKAQVATSGTCDNRPDQPAVGCKGYICPMWRLNEGFFDEAGFQIDHKVEVKHGGTNDPANLQALCPSCHSVKTKRCAKQKWAFTSEEIDGGSAHMALESNSKKRKRTED